jgi:hypothetical protein
MTPYRHILHQEIDGKLQQLFELHLFRNWSFAPTWLSSSREVEHIDWGTRRYELTHAELVRLAAEDGKEHLVSHLPESGRYAVDWQEGVGIPWDL